MKLIDSHAHLDFPTSSRKAGLQGTSVDNLDGILVRAKAAGVDKIITIGSSVECSERCIKIAEKHSDDKLKIWTSAGIHPKDGKEEVEKLGLLQCFKTLKQIAQLSKRVVAIGECGLDYYSTGDMKQVTSNKEKKFQRELFAGHIKLAAELNLPIVIHCRNGWDEIFKIISNIQFQIAGCFPQLDRQLGCCAKGIGAWLLYFFFRNRNIQKCARCAGSC